MKPLGLDGKASAPALVRANPLRGVFDKYLRMFLDAQRGAILPSHSTDRPLYALRGSIGWMDVLDIVRDEYPSFDPRSGVSFARFMALESLVHHCTGVLDDPVLVYDLDTPKLTLLVSRGLVQDRLVVANGSTRAILAGERAHVRLEGTAGVLRSNGGIALLSSGTVDYVELRSKSLYVSDRGTVPDGLVGLRDDSLAIVPVSQNYTICHSIFPVFDLVSGLLLLDTSSICGPADTAAIRSIHDRVLAAGDDPVALGDAYQEFRRRTFALGAVPVMRQLFRSGSWTFKSTRTFTPRGAP